MNTQMQQDTPSICELFNMPRIIRTTRTPFWDTLCRPMMSDPKSKQDKKMPKIQILQLSLHAAHLLKLFD